MVDWDKENYFSVLNVRKRKFEKERLERQVEAEAERKLKEEMDARQAEFARAEVERLKREQMAAALRCVSDLLDVNVNALLNVIMARVPMYICRCQKKVWLLWLSFIVHIRLILDNFYREIQVPYGLRQFRDASDDCRLPSIFACLSIYCGREHLDLVGYFLD